MPHHRHWSGTDAADRMRLNLNGSFEQSTDPCIADVSTMAFGGAWSGKKLDVLGEYLKAYTTALKNTRFRLAYIDAFAGAGIRELMPPSQGELFDDLLADDDANYRHGSPLIALGTEPSLDSFIFIERDAASIAKLKAQVASSYPLKANQVTYKHGDANEVLRDISSKNWSGRRAVAFLDPFALHVSWDTIAQIAGTESIDMWLLFPAMAVNRMLARDCDIPLAWSAKLTNTFWDYRLAGGFLRERGTRSVRG